MSKYQFEEDGDGTEGEGEDMGEHKRWKMKTNDSITMTTEGCECVNRINKLVSYNSRNTPENFTSVKWYPP